MHILMMKIPALKIPPANPNKIHPKHISALNVATSVLLHDDLHICVYPHEYTLTHGIRVIKQLFS